MLNNEYSYRELARQHRVELEDEAARQRLAREIKQNRTQIAIRLAMWLSTRPEAPPTQPESTES